MDVDSIKRAALSENWAKVRKLLSRTGLGRSSKYEVKKTQMISGLVRLYLYKNDQPVYLGRRSDQAEVSIGNCDEHGRSWHIFSNSAIDNSRLCLKCAADLLEAMGDDGQES